METPITSPVLGLLLIPAAAITILAVLGVAAVRGRRSLWAVAASIAAAALVTERLVPAGLPLYAYHCGSRCGEGATLAPTAVAFGALSAAVILSVRQIWAARAAHRVVVFVVTTWILLNGVDWWFN
jgi:hypothetical protein